MTGTKLPFKTSPTMAVPILPLLFLPQLGSNLLNYYDRSPSKLITQLLPEHPWEIWNFSSVPKRFWQEKANQINFMTSLANKLKLNDFTGWYRVTSKDIILHGGSGLLAQYNESLYNALKEIFPEVSWKPWKFVSAPKGCWENKEVQREFMQELAGKLNVIKMEDWYKVTRNDIIVNGGSTLLSRHNDSPIQLLTAIFPEYNWLPWKFSNVPQGKEIHSTFLI